MSNREELIEILHQEATADRVKNSPLRHVPIVEAKVKATADAILAEGYRKPRTITSAAQLEGLPFGSAVQTSDPSDVVVLRCEGNNFRNQSGCDLSATDLWRYGTRPFIVLFEPEES